MVRVVGSIDSFSRPDDPTGLASVPGGPPWTTAGGTWGIGDCQAYLARPDPNATLVVVDTGQGGGAVEVRLPTVVEGAGLVFRYRSPLEHWAVVAVHGYVTWAVVKVVGGSEEVVADTGLSSLEAGTTVAVRLDGFTIEVAIDGRLVQTITDPTLADATQAGLKVAFMPGVDAAGAASTTSSWPQLRPLLLPVSPMKNRRTDSATPERFSRGPGGPRGAFPHPSPHCIFLLSRRSLMLDEAGQTILEAACLSHPGYVRYF